MVSSKSKGDAFERQCVKKLELAGYVVMRSPRKFIMIGSGRFISKANDYFGLFDICAKKHNQTRWIQCKTGVTKSHVSDVRRRFKSFMTNTWVNQNQARFGLKKTAQELLRFLNTMTK